MPVPDPTASRAVLIGVDGYAHPDLEPLPAAAAGARRFAELLRDPSVWGLPAAHVTLLGTDASVSRILGAVRDAALEATETLLVYFAGHGLRDRDEKLYLALAEADADHPQIGTLQYRTLRDVVRQAGYRARHRVTVLDCCYRGLAGATSGAGCPGAAAPNHSSSPRTPSPPGSVCATGRPDRPPRCRCPSRTGRWPSSTPRAARYVPTAPAAACCTPRQRRSTSSWNGR
ncbi:caspase family protein [Streptomyces sp. NPDC091682]|uniref:caspase, EACC1-associated type n=1 Tax=Streptomyces sp. NPDC091682 TaxID=3366005 RepID=UPI0037F981B0